jgi:hypothetical protein
MIDKDGNAHLIAQLQRELHHATVPLSEAEAGTVGLCGEQEGPCERDGPCLSQRTRQLGEDRQVRMEVGPGGPRSSGKRAYTRR